MKKGADPAPLSCFASACGLCRSGWRSLSPRRPSRRGTRQVPRRVPHSSARPERGPQGFPGAPDQARAGSSRRGPAAAGSVRTTRVPRAERALDRDVAAVQLDDALDDRQAQAAAALAGGRRDRRAALVEAVEQLRQVGRRDARAVVGDAHLDARRRAPRRPSVTRAPRGQNLSALSTRLATARSNSSTSSAAHGRLPSRRRRVGCAARTPWLRGALGEAQRDVVEQLAGVDRLGAQLNSGSSSLARSPSDCTMRAALRVLRSAISTRRRSSARAGVAGPAAVERLEAGDGRGQRRAQVVRQVADAFAPEVVERRSAFHCAPADVEQHLEGAASAGRTRPASAPAAGCRARPARPSARPRCDSVATASVRRRSGRVTEAMISAASSVVSATTRERSAPSAGRAKLLRSTSQRPSGSCCVCSTR